MRKKTAQPQRKHRRTAVPEERSGLIAQDKTTGSSEGVESVLDNRSHRTRQQAYERMAVDHPRLHHAACGRDHKDPECPGTDTYAAEWTRLVHERASRFPAEGIRVSRAHIARENPHLRHIVFAPDQKAKWGAVVEYEMSVHNQPYDIALKAAERVTGVKL